MTITLAHVLAGCATGEVQTAGLLQVIPLISQIQDNRFGPVHKALISTTDYGTLVVKNPMEKILLLPKDATYITGQKTQDHTLTHASLIPANHTARFSDAACVQQTQGGYMKEGEHELGILPFPLREKAMQVRYTQSYQKLWADITRFNRLMGVAKGNSGHLEYFTATFELELARFVSEFENVPHQVGAIILLWDGEQHRVVGIERSPNVIHWRSVWSALIRDCYGALAMLTARENNRLKPIEARRLIDGDITTLSDLRAAYEQAEADQDEAAKQVVRDLAQEPLDKQFDKNEAGLDIFTLSSERYVGQVVQDSNVPIYASLVMTEAARKFKEIKLFTI